jgi:TPR repeat protein
MFQLGRGVAPDDEQAEYWYRQAANQNLPQAQLKLGNFYQAGRGVAQSDSEAVKWFRRAAMAGYAVAQSNLATMYAACRGVEQDPVIAYAWFELARRGGLAQAGEWQQSLKQKLSRSQRKAGLKRAEHFQARISAVSKTHKRSY